ncbi:MAG TPA: sugar phosphate nucleotidyltransferase [Acidobacteriota bacterium]|jgi:mannose-1-phosphate guanylyltransferase
MKKKHWHAVIMAGGSGTRFWPKSRQSRPKQLLPIVGEESMIRQTFLRLKGFLPPSQIWIVAGQDHVALIRKQIPELPPAHVIAEPCARNTAPCVALAGFTIAADPDSIMFVLPADHMIRDHKGLHQNLTAAAAVASRHDALVTFGIQPTFAATGYGYLELETQSSAVNGISYHRLRRFIEKPDEGTAKRYIASGNYLWNSGMFVWKFGRILESFRRFMPEVHAGLSGIDWKRPRRARAELRKVYPQLQSLSIDYGIMEKAGEVYAMRTTFNWSDVGSWDAVAPFLPRDQAGNVSRDKLIPVDSRDLIVDAPGKLVAAIGVRDLIIVDTEDALLICEKSRAQDVRKVTEQLKLRRLKRYL